MLQVETLLQAMQILLVLNQNNISQQLGMNCCVNKIYNWPV